MLQKKKKNTKHLGEILPPPLRKQLQGKVTSAKSSMGSLWLGLLPAYAPPLCTPRRPPRHPPSSSPLSLPTLGLTDLQGPAPARIPWNSVLFFFFFLGGGHSLSQPRSGRLRWLTALPCPNHRPSGHGLHPAGVGGARPVLTGDGSWRELAEADVSWTPLGKAFVSASKGQKHLVPPFLAAPNKDACCGCGSWLAAVRLQRPRGSRGP